MNTKEQIKLNFDSYEFYGKEIIKKEKEFFTEFDRVIELEQWDKLNKVIEMGRSYLMLSQRFLVEIDGIQEQIPILFDELRKAQGDKWRGDDAIHRSYSKTVEGTRKMQKAIHKKMVMELEMLERLRKDNGYGSYE